MHWQMVHGQMARQAVPTEWGPNMDMAHAAAALQQGLTAVPLASFATAGHVLVRLSEHTCVPAYRAARTRMVSIMACSAASKTWPSSSLQGHRGERGEGTPATGVCRAQGVECAEQGRAELRRAHTSAELLWPGRMPAPPPPPMTPL